MSKVENLNENELELTVMKGQKKETGEMTKKLAVKDTQTSIDLDENKIDVADEVEDPKPVRRRLTAKQTQTSREIDEKIHTVDEDMLIRKQLSENEESKTGNVCEKLDTEVAKLTNLAGCKGDIKMEEVGSRGSNIRKNIEQGKVR